MTAILVVNLCDVHESVNFALVCVLWETISTGCKKGPFIFAGQSITRYTKSGFKRHTIPRQEHACSELCADAGICEINTAPRSVESTFRGVHETFQYTKV